MRVPVTTRLIVLTLIALVGGGWTTAFAQLGSQRPTEERIKSMGRPERGAMAPVVIEKLGLEPGDIVADIGAGAGAFALPMAKAIAPDGVLYAVDIDQGLLDYIDAKAKEEGITNIRTILGEYDDPKLPVKNVDVAFFHRVLHMIERRQAYINNLVQYLEPDGRIVIIEKEREDVDDWMWLKRSDVDNWMAALSFYPAEKFGVFDDRWFVSYQRPYGDSVLLKKREPAREAPAPEPKR